MAIKLADVLLYLGVDSGDLDDGLGKAEEKTKSWGGRVGGTITKVLGGAVVGAGALAAGAIIKVAKDGLDSFITFQDGMNEVFTLLPGISQDAMGDMTKQVKGFAKEMGVLPEDVIPALYQALSAGVPPDNVFEFLKQSQKAAVGGVAELSTAVDGISSVVNAYGADVLSAAQASDLMFTAVKLGKTDFNQLSQSLFNVIPTASSLGVNFGDVTAALAVLTAQGTPTAVATTQIRQLLVELSQASSKASQSFTEMSGQSFPEFIAAGGNVQDALKIMEQAAADSGVRLSDMFSSVEAGNAALGLTGGSTEKFTSALEQMANATGATDAAYDQMQSGIAKSLDKIKASWAVVVLEVGEKLAPHFEKAADFIADSLPRISEVVATVFDFLIEKTGWAVDFVQGLFSGQLNDTLSQGVGYFAFFKDWIDTNLPLVQQLIETILNNISSFWENNGAAIMAIVMNTFDTVWTVIDVALKTILDTVTFVLQLLNGDFEGAGKTLAGIVERIWNGILEIVGNALENIGALITGIDWPGLGLRMIEGIAMGIGAAGQTLYYAMTNVLQDAFDGAKEWLGIHSPSARAEDELGEPTGEGTAVGFVKKLRAMVPTMQSGLDTMFGSLQAPTTNLAAAAAGPSGGAGYTITINQTFNGPANEDDVRRGAQSGILDAMRNLGLR